MPDRAKGERTALLAPAGALGALAIGGAIRLVVGDDAAHDVMMFGVALAGIPVVWRTTRAAFRGHFATDIVASLAIVGAVVTGQPFAGLIVVLMQTGGEALERYAAGRASAALRQLEADAPRVARRVDVDGGIRDVRVDEVRVGDILVIRPGDVVPCDAIVSDGHSHLDTARITGEPIPRRAEAGSRITSGMVNLEGALTVRALAAASESQYARIVALVRSAQESKAPLQRLADRYAVWFTPATLVVCAVTWWLTRDASRVLAILTVATPCPLILATPVAIIGGINQAARRHVIIRDGAALEALASVDAVVFDKTGTVTTGEPAVVGVHSLAAHNEAMLLRLAGSLEQFTSHVVGRAIAARATAQGIALTLPSHVSEAPGEGMVGTVDHHRVVIGGTSFVEHHLGNPIVEGGASRDGRLRAWIAVDGVVAGYFALDDAPRPSVRPAIEALRALGIWRSVMLSGDDDAHTRAVAREIGIDESSGRLLPGDKARYVAGMQHAGSRVLMVGDGINDAPVLAAANVGVAVAAHGGGIAAEAADAVLLSDDLGAVADAVRIGQRSLGIARQSIRVGLGLSAAAMVLAAGGIVAPFAGALIQEAIDIAVIVNALRTAVPPRRQRKSTSDTESAAPSANRPLTATA